MSASVSQLLARAVPNAKGLRGRSGRVDDGRAAPAKPARIKRQQTPALGLLSRGGVVDDEEDEDMGEGEEGGE